MIDYQSHLAALNHTINKLKKVIDTNGSPEYEQVYNMLNENFSYAFLGSIYERLLEHDKAADIELERLAKASELYEMVKNYYSGIGNARDAIESLILDPNQSDITMKYNKFYDEANELESKFQEVFAKLATFNEEFKDIKHVTQHGQATDEPVTNWNWRDIVLSRRTGMFVSNMWKIAKSMDNPKALSFAYGAITSYTSNITGSAYINQTVGGPRRSFPHRDRLASYTMGAWFMKNRPDLTTSFNDLVDKLSFGAPDAPSLPEEINELLMESLYNTYGHLKEYPNLNLSYQKLINHLKLLASFTPLPEPKPINNNIFQTMSDNDYALYDGGPNNGTNPSPSNSGDFDIEWYYWVIFGVCIAAVAACYFSGICGPPDREPRQGPFLEDDRTVGHLTSTEATIDVDGLFKLHINLFNMSIYGLKSLKLVGMIYPDSSDLGEEEFHQFTVIPFIKGGQNYLKKQFIKKDKFLAFPETDDESPQVRLFSIYPENSNPNIFLEGSEYSYEEYGFWLFSKVIDGTLRELEEYNFNLDADREYKHLCWEVSSGSILDNPVLVSILRYGSM